MPSNDEIIKKWSDIFISFGMSKDCFLHALQTRPEEADLENLYQVLTLIRKGSPSYSVTVSWELVMLSGNLAWVNKLLETADTNLKTVGGDTFALMAMLCGNIDCVLAVLRKNPSLKDVKNSSSGFDLQYYANLSYMKNKIDYNTLLSHLDLATLPVPELRSRILSGTIDWENNLIKLKKIADQALDPIAKNHYLECANFHVERLKRLLASAEGPSPHLTSLTILANAGIESAGLALNSYSGLQSLKAAKKLLEQHLKSSVFSRFIGSNTNSPITLLLDAKSKGIVEANFYLGNCSRTPELYDHKPANFEDAARYYYEGALADDIQCRVELKNLSHSGTKAEDRFYSKLYLAFLNRDRAAISEARQSNSGLFAKFAEQHTQDLTIDLPSRILLAVTAIPENPVLFKNLLFKLVESELKLTKAPKSKIDFCDEVKTLIAGQIFTAIALQIVDQMQIDSGSRLALLLVVSTLTQDMQAVRIIDTHLATFTEEMTREYSALYPAAQCNKGSSSSSSFSPISDSVRARPLIEALVKVGLQKLSAANIDAAITLEMFSQVLNETRQSMSVSACSSSATAAPSSAFFTPMVDEQFAQTVTTVAPSAPPDDGKGKDNEATSVLKN